jgi:4-oxalocrotonate tautomerase
MGGSFDRTPVKSSRLMYAAPASGTSSVSVPELIQFVNWRLSVQAWDAASRGEVDPDAPARTKKSEGNVMPLVDIQLIEGVFDKTQKQAMIGKITDAMVEIEGEAMRGVTWVRVHEVASGNWGIGGRAMTAADVKALQGSRK